MIETPDVGLVVEALRRGARVVWDPPRFRGPSPALALAKKAAETAREVLHRAEIFRAQAQERSPIPLLVLPDVAETPEGCLSCGAPILEGFRCRLCQLAVHLALDLEFGEPHEEND